MLIRKSKIAWLSALCSGLMAPVTRSIFSEFQPNFQSDFQRGMSENANYLALQALASSCSGPIECWSDMWAKWQGPASETREFRKPNGAHQTIPKPPLPNNGDTLATTARKNDLGVFRLRKFGVSHFTIIDSLLFQAVNKMPIILLHSSNSFKTSMRTAIGKNWRLFPGRCH